DLDPLDEAARARRERRRLVGEERLDPRPALARPAVLHVEREGLELAIVEHAVRRGALVELPRAVLPATLPRLAVPHGARAGVGGARLVLAHEVRRAVALAPRLGLLPVLGAEPAREFLEAVEAAPAEVRVRAVEHAARD